MLASTDTLAWSWFALSAVGVVVVPLLGYAGKSFLSATRQNTVTTKENTDATNRLARAVDKLDFRQQATEATVKKHDREIERLWGRRSGDQ